MKSLPALFLAALALTTPQITKASPDETFETHKARMIAETDEQIKHMQDLRTCLSDAKEHTAMRTCHEAMRKFHEERMGAHREKRKGRLEERVKKLEEKSAKTKN